MVMIEAMALGCPVISFARGAAPEIITEGETGYLVKNVDAMVSAIAKIDLIDRETVRKYVEQNFSSQVMAKNYIKIYKKVIQIQKQKVSALDTATSRKLVEVPTTHSILKVSPKTCYEKYPDNHSDVYIGIYIFTKYLSMLYCPMKAVAAPLNVK